MAAATKNYRNGQKFTNHVSFSIASSVLVLLLCSMIGCGVVVDAVDVPPDLDPLISVNFSSVLTNLTDILVLAIEPPNELKLFEEQEVDVTVSWYLNWTASDQLNAIDVANLAETVTCPAVLSIATTDDYILTVINGSTEVNLAVAGEWNVTLRGMFIGYAHLLAYIEWLDVATPCRLVSDFVTQASNSSFNVTTSTASQYLTSSTTEITPEFLRLEERPYKDPFADDPFFANNNDYSDPEIREVVEITTAELTTTTTTEPTTTTIKATTTTKRRPRSKATTTVLPSTHPVTNATRVVTETTRLQTLEESSVVTTLSSKDSDGGEVMPESASQLLQPSDGVHGADELPVLPETVSRDVVPDFLTNSDKSLEVPAVVPETPATKAPPPPLVAPVTLAKSSSGQSFLTPSLNRDEELSQYENIYSEGATYQSFRRRRRRAAVYLGRKVTDEEVGSSCVDRAACIAVPLDYRVGVMRNAGLLDIIFIVLITIVVGVNTLMMGCQLDLTVVKQVLKKPIGPVVGFISQFLFMPLSSYGLGLLLFTDVNLQLGLFALGCSPGGNGSNFWTLLLKGDVDLSITMTFVSTICAIFMMPFWLFTLGQSILDKGEIVIPFGNLFMSLLMFTIPLSIGVIIRHFKPNWAAFARKCIRPLTVVLIIVMPTIAMINSMFIFSLMTWQTIVAGLCVAWGGYTFGALFSWLARMKRPQIIAVSIETAIQNAGVAFMVLRLTLGQPDADLSSVAPVSQLMVTGLPLLAIYLPIMIRRKCMERRAASAQKKADKKAAAEKEKEDMDATDPLVVNRQPSIARGAAPAKPGALMDKTRGSDVLAVSGIGPLEQRKFDNGARYTAVNKQEPVYANMYMEYDEKALNRMYDKPTLILKQSLEIGPIREDDHEFENFRNGHTLKSVIVDPESPLPPPPPSPLSPLPPLINGDVASRVDSTLDENGYYESIN